MGWDWNAEKTSRWLEPAPEMNRLAARWKDMGLLRLLDRGCGPGRHAILFAQMGFSVTGMDLSPEALEHLRQWADQEKVKVAAVKGDMFAMPFPDNSFDCVLDYNVSYHTDTQGYFQAVKELRRVLRPGGEVYLTLKSRRDPAYLQARPEEHMDRFTLVQAGGTPHFYGDETDFQELFQGFSLAEPPREVTAPGLDNPTQSVHYHLLLRKEEAL